MQAQKSEIQICSNKHETCLVFSLRQVVYDSSPQVLEKLDNQLEGITIPNPMLSERRKQKACPSK